VRKRIPVVEWIMRARSEKWALGQFNMSNLETLQGIVYAAVNDEAPLLIGVSMGTIHHAGLGYIRHLIAAVKEETTHPLYFHLDHGPNVETVKAAIDAGFDSVMLDTSRFSVEENVRNVREAVTYAHAHGIGFEAQIGETWDEETGEQMEKETDPEEAAEFVHRTGIDYLAISFGNTPGRLEGESNPRVDIISETARMCSLPIVLHGGTSIPDSFVRAAIGFGASKINIDTHIRKAVVKSLTDSICRGAGVSDPRVAFKAVRDATSAAVGEKIALFGSKGRVAGASQ
jgi:ketose-bisphosphate aldolase